MKTQKLTELSLLTAAAVIMFAVELQIPYPFPVPGIKLGLSNIVTVYVLMRYSPKEALFVLVSRILLAGAFSSNAFAVLYSLSGGLLSLAGMQIVRKQTGGARVWLISVFGALFHNLGQMLCAIIVTKTPALIVYFPFLMVSGCLAGAFTGFAAQYTLKRLSKKGGGGNQ